MPDSNVWWVARWTDRAGALQSGGEFLTRIGINADRLIRIADSMSEADLIEYYLGIDGQPFRRVSALLFRTSITLQSEGRRFLIIEHPRIQFTTELHGDGKSYG